MLQAQLIKITLQVPHGVGAAPRPALHTSGGIRQAQSLIISEITLATLATLTAEAKMPSRLISIISFHGNSCTCQSQLVQW